MRPTPRAPGAALFRAALVLLLLPALLATPALAQQKPAAKAPAKPPAKAPARVPAKTPATTTAKAAATTAAKPAAKPPAKPTGSPATRAAAKPATARPAAPKPVAAKPAVTRPVPAATVVAAPEPPPADAMRAAREVPLRAGPGGRALATLAPGAIVTPVAREGGWVRVRVDAWVPEADLLPADVEAGAPRSAADLRADPEGTRGRTVRWEVELLAFQTADPLRRELAEGEPYLLARGPGTEDAMLYLALPPSLAAEARGVAPLTRLLVTARVRNGRSAPLGVPVLDLLAFTPVRGR